MSWITGADLPDAVRAKVTDPVVLDDAAAAASAVLFRLSGGRWAGPVVARVELTPASPSWSPLSRLTPYPTVAQLARNGHRSSSGTRLRLPDYPVRYVAQVTAGGVVLSSGWRLTDGAYLERTDGGSWAGTVSVVYVHGSAPPAEARAAAAALAGDLALARVEADAGTSRLPRRVQTITRQAVTMALLDPMDLFDRGHTGIPEVDLWLSSVGGRGSTASTWTPETHPAVVRLPSPAVTAPGVPRRDLAAAAGYKLDVEFEWLAPGGTTPEDTTGEVGRFRLASVTGETLLDDRSDVPGDVVTATGPGLYRVTLPGDLTATLPPFAAYSLANIEAGGEVGIAGGLLTTSPAPLVVGA